MVSCIPEDDWKDAVQIIGWLYQYYNTEPKDKVFADLKKNIKISKENIPAATQLFTPDWIVRYMVENSLGRLWLEHLKAERESGTLFVPAKGIPAHQNPDGAVTIDATGEGELTASTKKSGNTILMRQSKSRRSRLSSKNSEKSIEISNRKTLSVLTLAWAAVIYSLISSTFLFKSMNPTVIPLARL
jgi:hypothetical protein